MTIKVTYNVTDVYMSQSVSPVYINVSYSDGGASGGGVWGSITGTLSNQTDLQNALNLKVPYTGATTNVNLGEYELKAGQVTLDTSPTGTAAVGTTRWNDTTGTSETTLKGGNVIIKNGVDLVARVVNKVTPNTTLTKAAYQAVRVSGAQGQRLAVALAQANNDAGSADTIGLVTETIAPNQEGFIMTMGQLENINTTGSLQGETWVDGDVLYLSPTTAGAITNVQPTGSGHIVVIGYVEYAHANNGKIYVKVLNGWELTELHDTEIVNPLNNEGLFYESSTALWKNKSISTVLGYTPEQPLTFNSPLSRAGNVVSIPQATGSVNGFLSATDWTTFNSKQAALGFTPANAATTLTINGVTFDLSANRSWTIAAGISGSGAAGQVTYWTGASAVSGSNNLFWDNTNSRLGIGTNAPTTPLTVSYSNNTYATGLSIINTSSSTTSLSGVRFMVNNVEGGAIAYQPSNYILAAQASTLVVASAGNNRIGFIANSNQVGVAQDIFFSTFGSNTTYQLLIKGNTGNLLINGTSDNGQRLQVYGDTLLRGSGNTSATTALTVQNSSSTNLFRVSNAGEVNISTITASSGIYILNLSNSVSTVFRLRDDGALLIGSASASAAPIIYAFEGTVGNRSLRVGIQSAGSLTPVPAFNINQESNFTYTTGTGEFTTITANFLPTSGTGTLAYLSLKGTINQTGGANGITRGLYVNPTLTAAADFRAIETSAGNVLFGSNFTWNNTSNRLELNGTDSGDSVRIINRGFITFSDTTNALTSRFRGISAGFVFQDAAFNTRAQISTGAGLTYFNAAGGGVMIGTSTDLGVRLGVVGDTILRGSGATSATTALTVQNSSSTNLFTVRNDGVAEISSNGGRLRLTQNVAGSTFNGIDFTTSGTVYASFIGNQNTGEIRLSTVASYFPTFYSSGSEAMRISTSRNLLIGTVTDIASSILTINSTTQGFLPPRMTTTQKNAIATPAAGLVVYDTTLNKLCVYTTAWETITSI